MDLEALVVGGGIHGVGTLHDLASRGLREVRLVERGRLASGTSSRSTKLLHGGLRYLEHPLQWGLVREALRERTVLLDLLASVVRPLPIVLPCVRGSRPPWMLRAGLWLYDHLAGGSNVPRARRLEGEQLRSWAPYLLAGGRDFSGSFLYHDVQMNDDVVVRLVAAAARKLGAQVTEHTAAVGVTPLRGGFRVELEGPEGRQSLTTRAVVNAAGAWCTANLLRWGLRPEVSTLLNVGSHLVLGPAAVDADPARSAAVLFQNGDGRIVFFIPWGGRWLLGTTESLFAGNPDNLEITTEDRAYLLAVARGLVRCERPEDHIVEGFVGIRTFPAGPPPGGPRGPISDAWREKPFASPFYLSSFSRSLSALSREAALLETVPGLLSLYGGKFTTYRSQCERIGDRVCRRLGHRGASATRDPRAWFLDELRAECPECFESDPSLRHV